MVPEEIKLPDFGPPMVTKRGSVVWLASGSKGVIKDETTHSWNVHVVRSDRFVWIAKDSVVPVIAGEETPKFERGDLVWSAWLGDGTVIRQTDVVVEVMFNRGKAECSPCKISAYHLYLETSEEAVDF